MFVVNATAQVIFCNAVFGGGGVTWLPTVIMLPGGFFFFLVGGGGESPTRMSLHAFGKKPQANPCMHGSLILLRASSFTSL